MRHQRVRAAAAAALIAAPVLFPLILTAIAGPAGAVTSTVPPPLAGVWRTDDEAVFEITQSQNGSFDSAVHDDACTGGPRTFVLKGSANGTYLEGTMQRCDPADSKLVTDCGLNPLWDTPFTANFTETEIVGYRRGEYYLYDTDANGNLTNCTFDHYTDNYFTYTRMDCALKSFEALGERYVADNAARPTDVDMAKRMEAGETLQWTEEQLAPGGLKEKAEAFKAGLLRYAYTGTINSAFRPVSYQGHFADIRLCALEILNNIKSYPEVEPYMASAIGKLKAEIAKHGLKSEDMTAGSTTIPVPYVCWREPLTNCPHVDGRAVDMTIRVDDNETLDWIGAMYGFCRPYRDKDRPHWDFVGDYPFGVEKCGYLGTGPGEATITIEGHSPVNLVVEDPYGNRVGFDAALGGEVNDLGASNAYYSGPGTQPQVIQIFAGSGAEGNYTVSGVGTGNGSYTLTVAVADDLAVVDEVSQAGTAIEGQPIAPLRYAMKRDYAAPFPLRVGQYVSASPSGAVKYAVASGNGTYEVEVTGSGIAIVASAPDAGALVLSDSGAGGALRVVLPASVVGGTAQVRADGAAVVASQKVEGPSVVLTFDRPAGTKFITIEGVAGQGTLTDGPPPTGGGPGAGAGSALVLGAVAVAAAAAVVVAFLLLRARKARP